jgi:hypothetical protein
MTGEIVDDDDVARPQGPQQHCLAIAPEPLAIVGRGRLASNPASRLNQTSRFGIQARSIML